MPCLRYYQLILLKKKKGNSIAKILQLYFLHYCDFIVGVQLQEYSNCTALYLLHRCIYLTFKMILNF